jgi:predicted enzyme related to lactoylglutathione lyase
VGSTFTELIVDATDPEGLAAFWSAALGWERTDADADAVEIADPSGSRPAMVFVRVREPKTLKNRVHIDVNPTGCDQREEVERLVALGARPVDIGQGEQTWVVLADPEGNEFCVLGPRLS